MAELLILVVIVGVVLLYAADRARKLRARARQMSGMNERLDVAAAKVDEQQERKQARVRASAELTSVLPAIKRPPLTLPGVPGPAAEPEDEPAAAEPEAGPAAGAAADDTSATADDTPAVADAENTPDAAEAEENPAAQVAPDGADGPIAGDGTTAEDSPSTGKSRATGESPVARESSADEDSPATADEVRPEPVRTPEGTLTMGQVIPDATPAPKPRVTSDGTMIMPTVPGQGPAPAGEAAPPPAPSRARPRASRPRAGQPRTGQARTGQPRSSRPSTSQEQVNRD
jgi:type II secretory pathway pseudopilin PulG